MNCLELEVVLAGNRQLSLFVNHLKSKRPVFRPLAEGSPRPRVTLWGAKIRCAPSEIGDFAGRTLILAPDRPYARRCELQACR